MLLQVLKQRAAIPKMSAKELARQMKRTAEIMKKEAKYLCERR